MTAISVFVAHTYPLIRKGFACTIAEDPDLVLVGDAGDTGMAIKEIKRVRPQVALVELQADNGGGIRICEAVKSEGFATRVLLLTTEPRGEDLYQAITLGAAGYLTGSESLEDILTATKGVVAGNINISSDAQVALQRYLQERQAEMTSGGVMPQHPLLSETELRILYFVAQGLSITETARAMNLSDSTIKNHRQSLFTKLGVPNAPAAVYVAIQRGLLK